MIDINFGKHDATESNLIILLNEAYREKKHIIVDRHKLKNKKPAPEKKEDIEKLEKEVKELDEKIDQLTLKYKNHKAEYI